MNELIVVLLICVAWAITSIIIKLIERRCKHEWEAVLRWIKTPEWMANFHQLKTGTQTTIEDMHGNQA